MIVYGWTSEQWAYAKQRHKLHGNSEAAADLQGMVEVQAWWRSHSWPEPMSVRLEGVVLESDRGWAAKAMHAAALVF
jgi:hypothetical protein